MSDIAPEPHLLIQADNLEWLTEEVAKEEDSLRKGVDVCYLDPPYNTGNSNQTGFSYNDCFVGDTWTQFMRERLNLVKQLLKDTGVIAISIDDSEVHYLRVLMDEIFGRNNFIAQLTIDGGANKNQANFFSVTHDYMVIYAMNKNKLKKAKTKWRKRREGIELLLKEYEKQKKKKKTPEEITVHLKEWVKTQPLSKRLKVFYNADSKGLYTYADLSVPGTSYEYEVLHPETKLPVQVPSRGWGLSEARFKELDEQGLIIWGKDETYQPLKKLYLKDKKDQLMKSVLSYPSRSSTHLLEKMLGKRGSFNNPKNLQMMKDILDYITPVDGVVLDCFAGTGTTGHAVLELNQQPESNRRFILVTNNESNSFHEVAKPRLEQVYAKLNPERPLVITYPLEEEAE